MAKARYTMQPLPGLLRAGPDGGSEPVIVTPYTARVVVRGQDDIVAVPMKRLRRDSTNPARPVLYRTDRRLWSLTLADVTPDCWVHGIASHKRRPWRALLIVALLLAAIIVALWAGRDRIVIATAPLLPHRVTDAIGRDYLAAMGRQCDNGAGSAALLRLAARLAPPTLPEPLSVTVIESPEVNAVALPGGHVALYHGLIAEAKSPDEVAAALAHEIGHIAYQHPNQQILRASGPAVVARTLGSDAAETADLTVLTKGDKAAEAEADDGAIALLAAANISTQGAADFFNRLGRLSTIFDSGHPSDMARARRFAGAVQSGTTPAMSAADWAALQAICGADT